MMGSGISGRYYGTHGSGDHKNSGQGELFGNTTILTGKQEKHIAGSKNYTAGKSVITVSIPKLQELVNTYAGTGEKINKDKERVDFHTMIGYYVHNEEKLPTTKGLIHYSKKGVHVVPSDPRGVIK